MQSILLVDDDESFTTATAQIVELLGHNVTIAPSIKEALDHLSNNHFDILLLDIMLPDGNGFDVLDKLTDSNRPGHIAFITGHTSIKTLIKSVAGPGISYLLKPVNVDAIRSILNQTAPRGAAPEDNKKHFGILIGESAEMQSVYEMINRVAATRANVMIQGESGTGKELVAQAIHNAAKPGGKFVAANCGAISPELIGSELFGHEKGAFTGAIARKAGLFEQAQGGTLFLDEVTEMPIDLQPNLLRVLETETVTRLGSTESIKTDCRVISATNRSARQMAEDNCLREDIYFRLAVFPIELPALRHRQGDIPLLAESFLHELNAEHGTDFKLNEQTINRLVNYSWPGNVRELRHSIYRAFIMTDPGHSHLQLPKTLGSPFSKEAESQNTLKAGRTIQEMERELINLTLEKVDNDKPKAARMLGISLKTLYNRLNEYESEV